MKELFRLLIIMFSMIFMLAGCQWNATPTDPLSNLGIPETGYEQRFSPVKSAVLYVDGEQLEIAADDPRLLRVLNFLGYSAETMQYGYITGFVYEEQIEQYYTSKTTILEVSFDVDLEGEYDTFLDTPRILICGDSYVLFFANNPTGAEGRIATRHWPYSMNAPEDSKKSNHSLDDWGGEYWLDILEYCGF